MASLVFPTPGRARAALAQMITRRAQMIATFECRPIVLVSLCICEAPSSVILGATLYLHGGSRKEIPGVSKIQDRMYRSSNNFWPNKRNSFHPQNGHKYTWHTTVWGTGRYRGLSWGTITYILTESAIFLPILKLSFVTNAMRDACRALHSIMPALPDNGVICIKRNAPNADAGRRFPRLLLSRTGLGS